MGEKGHKLRLCMYHQANTPDLLCGASGGSVGDGPGRLLPRLELGLGLDVDKDREYVGVGYRLKQETELVVNVLSLRVNILLSIKMNRNNIFSSVMLD